MPFDQISVRAVSKPRTGPLLGSVQWTRSSTLVYYQVRLDPIRERSSIDWNLSSLFSSVYAGHHSILIDPAEVEMNPSVWMNTISHYKSKSDEYSIVLS